MGEKQALKNKSQERAQEFSVNMWDGFVLHLTLCEQRKQSPDANSCILKRKKLNILCTAVRC